MKKITAILCIVFLSLFISTSIGSADYKGWSRFSGVYEMRANGSCLHSTNGFDQTEDGFWIPKSNSPRVWGATIMAYGIWEFKRDGSGEASGMNYVIDFQPGSPNGIPPETNSGDGPKVRDNSFEFSFKFEVEHNGSININVGPNYFELDGMVSKNRKTITIDSVYQFFGPGAGGPAYCNFQRVLSRVSK